MRNGGPEAIGVSSKKRAPAAPGANADESRSNGFTYYAWCGMFAAGGTPQAALKGIHDGPVKILKGTANQKKLLDQGLEPRMGI